MLEHDLFRKTGAHFSGSCIRSRTRKCGSSGCGAGSNAASRSGTAARRHSGDNGARCAGAGETWLLRLPLPARRSLARAMGAGRLRALRFAPASGRRPASRPVSMPRFRRDRERFGREAVLPQRQVQANALSCQPSQTKNSPNKIRHPPAQRRADHCKITSKRSWFPC